MRRYVFWNPFARPAARSLSPRLALPLSAGTMLARLRKVPKDILPHLMVVFQNTICDNKPNSNG